MDRCKCELYQCGNIQTIASHFYSKPEFLCASCQIILTIKSDYFKMFAIHEMELKDIDYSDRLCSLFSSILFPHSFCYVKRNKMLFHTMIKALSNMYQSGINIYNMHSLAFTVLESERGRYYYQKDLFLNEVNIRNQCIARACNKLLLKAVTKQYLTWFITIDSGVYFEYFIAQRFDKAEKEDYEILFKENRMNFMALSAVISYQIKTQLSALMENKTVARILCHYNEKYKYIDKIRNSSLLHKNKYNGIRKVCNNFLHIHRMDQLQYVKCGNKKCNIDYYYHRFGKNPPAKITNSYGELSVLFLKWFKKNKRGNSSNKWFKCSACKMIYYCSKKCQKIDWSKGIPTHKSLCNQLA
eukprot:382644_1